MEKDERPSERPFLHLEEGLKLINGDNDAAYTLDDLIFKASTGQLTIYALAHNWNASKIYQIDNSKPNTDLKIRLTGPERPPLPQSTDPAEFERQKQAFENSSGVQDMVYGNRTVFGKSGSSGSLYALHQSGYKPIAAITFKQYYEGNTSAKIELNLSEILELTDGTKEFFFCSDPAVLLQEAIDKGKLYVTKDGMLAAFSKRHATKKNAASSASVVEPPQEETPEIATPADPVSTTATAIPEEDRYMTMEQVCAFLSTSRSTINDAIKTNRFPQKLYPFGGRSLRFDRAEIIAHMNASGAKSTAPKAGGKPVKK